MDPRVTDHVADRQYDGSFCVDESYIAQRPAVEHSVESVGVATAIRRTNGNQVDSVGRQRSRRLEAKSRVVSFHRGTFWTTGYRFVCTWVLRTHIFRSDSDSDADSESNQSLLSKRGDRLLSRPHPPNVSLLKQGSEDYRMTNPRPRVSQGRVHQVKVNY